MHINTNKPVLTDNNADNFKKIISYIENIKEEIAFNIDDLTKKIDILKKTLSNSSGGAGHIDITRFIRRRNMTASDIITKCDRIKPNVYPQSQKRDWLNKIESDIREYMCLYTNKDTDTDFEKEENPALSLPESESDIYVYYLISMIDLSNQEYSLYNNSSAFFNALFQKSQKKYRSQNKPQCKIYITN